MDSIRRYLFITFILAVLLGSLSEAAVPDIHGFSEFGFGGRFTDDSTKQDDFNYLENRFQLKTSYMFEGENILADKGGILNFKGDFVVDGYFNGATDFELRELNLSFVPVDFMDMKIGRQVLTWGTGDYLFVNDMFPKDYISFFIGRDDEYLKKPSDALRMAFYPKGVNVDFVVIPYFTPNTTAKGDRLSFYDSFQGEISGIRSDRYIVSPPFQMSNNEYALRIYRNWGRNEWALYYFRGFDKNPRSYKDEANRQLYYQRIDVYGWSLRGPWAGGIGNIEYGYYHSPEDADGDNRLIENSAVKAMTGYSKDLGDDWKVALQYLYEQKLDYDNYEDNLRATDLRFDEYRHLFTNRITKLFKNQTVMVSLFTFYSPSDDDGYVRPSVSYDVNDQWKVVFGANIPWGEDDITEFGQMKHNKNVFVRIGYNF